MEYGGNWGKGMGVMEKKIFRGPHMKCLLYLCSLLFFYDG
jgi:hypothetical protein